MVGAATLYDRSPAVLSLVLGTFSLLFERVSRGVGASSSKSLRYPGQLFCSVLYVIRAMT